jgi:hypothetical protein
VFRKPLTQLFPVRFAERTGFFAKPLAVARSEMEARVRETFAGELCEAARCRLGRLFVSEGRSRL